MYNENKKIKTPSRAVRNEEPERIHNRDIKLLRQIAAERDAQKPKQELTPEQLERIKAAVIKGADDFSYFCRAILGMRVHDGQAESVKLFSDHDFVSLACSNSWGKTTFIALVALWLSFYRKFAPNDKKPYSVMILGPEMEHSLIVHTEIEQIRLGIHRGQIWSYGPRADGKEHSFLLSNRLIPGKSSSKHELFSWRGEKVSQIQFASAKDKGSRLEGKGPNAIIYDEVRIERHLNYVVNNVLLPRGIRVPNFKIMLSSTPLSTTNAYREFFERGKKHEGVDPLTGKGGFASRTGSVYENSFLTPEQIEAVAVKLDARYRRQIMNGEFVESPDSYFILENVHKAMSLPAEDDIDKYRGKAIKGHTYVGGVDEASSPNATADDSVVTVWDVTQVPFRLVFERVMPKGTSTTELVRYCDGVIEEFNGVMGFDAGSGLGEEMEHNTSDRRQYYRPIQLHGGKAVKGDSIPKAKALANFRTMVDNGVWISPSIPELRGQIVGYELENDRDLETDRLMTQVNAAWLAREYIPDMQLPEAYELEFVDSLFMGDEDLDVNTDGRGLPLERAQQWKQLNREHYAKENAKKTRVNTVTALEMPDESDYEEEF